MLFARPAFCAVHVAGVLAVATICASPCLHAQTTEVPDAERDTRGSDSDPTRPVFFSLRPEFSNSGGDTGQFALILRYDTAIAQSKTIGAILRLELPVSGVHAGDVSAGGLGDAYVQVLVPWFLTRRFAIAAGTGLNIPTADGPLLGSGKWAIAPLVAPVWRLPRGLFYVKVQHARSIAGDASRADVDVLLVTPVFVRAIARDWWVSVDSESRTIGVPGGRTDIRSGVQLGRSVAPGVGAWIKPEVWWGPNRDGRWNLKFGLVWYERRPQPPPAAP